MSRAAEQSTQANPLYLVTFNNLDGSTKTVLKSTPFGYATRPSAVAQPSPMSGDA